MQKTIEMLNTVKKFIKLGIVSLLTNLMDYFDKFLIYPMFGAGSVAVYYVVASYVSYSFHTYTNYFLSFLSCLMRCFLPALVRLKYWDLHYTKVLFGNFY